MRLARGDAPLGQLLDSTHYLQFASPSIVFSPSVSHLPPQSKIQLESLQEASANKMWDLAAAHAKELQRMHAAQRKEEEARQKLETILTTTTVRSLWSLACTSRTRVLVVGPVVTRHSASQLTLSLPDAAITSSKSRAVGRRATNGTVARGGAADARRQGGD